MLKFGKFLKIESFNGVYNFQIKLTKHVQKTGKVLEYNKSSAHIEHDHKLKLLLID